MKIRQWRNREMFEVIPGESWDDDDGTIWLEYTIGSETGRAYFDEADEEWIDGEY